MKNMRIFRAAAIAFLLAALPASSQILELGVAGGPSTLNPNDLGSNSALDDGWSIVGRITINSDTIWGQEFGYAYNRTFLTYLGQPAGGMAYHQGFYNFLLYATREGSRVRPFVTGGGHFSNFVVPGASAQYGQGDNKFGVNYGGGIKIRLNERWLVRADYRQFLTGKPLGDFLPVSGSLRQNQISFGFAFTL
jgi:opacity protein-like surface antigen